MKRQLYRREKTFLTSQCFSVQITTSNLRTRISFLSPASWRSHFLLINLRQKYAGPRSPFGRKVSHEINNFWHILKQLLSSSDHKKRGVHKKATQRFSGYCLKPTSMGTWWVLLLRVCLAAKFVIFLLCICLLWMASFSSSTGKHTLGIDVDTAHALLVLALEI